MMSSSFGVISYCQKIIAGSLLFVTLLALAACGGGVVGDDKNYIIVKDQTVIYLDEVVIENVVADQNLLIVIYDESGVLPNTKSVTELGFVAVSAGDYQDVVVKLNKDIANNETLYAELRIDQGIIGEFDSADPLVVQAVSAISFGVIKSTDPYLEIWLDEVGLVTVVSPKKTPSSKPLAGGAVNYPVLKNTRIDVKKVIAAEDAWLVVFRVNVDSTEFVIGFDKLDAGHDSDFAISLNGTLSSADQIKVGLYNVSNPSSSSFDAALDEQVIFNNEPVQVDFVVQ